MDMSERIKFLRKKNNLTQEELSEKLGLGKAAIAKYETGRVKNIKRPMIEKMADIFDVSPAYLLGFDTTDIDEFAKEYEKGYKEEAARQLVETTIEVDQVDKILQLVKLLSYNAKLFELLEVAKDASEDDLKLAYDMLSRIKNKE